jgi:hypothetical protein
MAESQHMLICFSENFLSSNWTNAEFSATYSIQNNYGHKKVLPLILDSKDRIINTIALNESIILVLIHFITSNGF